MRLLGEVVYDNDSTDLNCGERGDLTFERYLREHHGAGPGAAPVGSRDRYLDRRLLLPTHILPASGATARGCYQPDGARVHRNLAATPIANRVPGLAAARNHDSAALCPPCNAR